MRMNVLLPLVILVAGLSAARAADFVVPDVDKVFEDTDLKWWIESANVNQPKIVAPWAFRVGKDRKGLYRFEVRDGDRSQVDKGQFVNRSELASARYPFGRALWASYAFFVEPGPPLKPHWKSFCVIGQWHQTPDPDDIAQSPIFATELLAGDAFQVVIRYDADRRSVGHATAQYLYTAKAPIQRGRWHYVVEHWNFDWRQGGSGLTQVWLDGKQVADYHGPVGYNDLRGPYFKFGIYKEEAPESIAVRYANMELGYTDLSRRIRDPLPAQ